MKAYVQHYYDTTDGWEKINPVLYNAMWGIEQTADGKILLKLGDGKHHWKDLKYFDEENINGLPEKLKSIITDIANVAGRLNSVNDGIDNIKELLDNEIQSRKEEDDNIINAIKELAPEGLENIPAKFDEEIHERQSADKILQQNINSETQQRQQADQILQQNIDNESQQRQQTDQKLKNEINSKTGNGGRLSAFDFGKALDENNQDDQLLLTEYALSQIPSIDDPLKIWNSTSVRNLYNGNVFILNNTQDTDPPIFEWADDGPSLIKSFTENMGGFIVGGDPEIDSPDYVFPQLSGKGKINLEAIKWLLHDFEHPVGDIQVQLPNGLSPKDKGWGEIWKLGDSIVLGKRYWEICNGRAYGYRLRQTALPNYTTYTPGNNIAANAVVMYHLQLPNDPYGDDWGFFKAKEALTNVPAQLDPIKFDQLEEGQVVFQRYLHDYTVNDYAIGQQVIGGDFDGYYVEAVLVYGGKYFSPAGGNRPPFGEGTTGDVLRPMTGSLSWSDNNGELGVFSRPMGVFNGLSATGGRPARGTITGANSIIYDRISFNFDNVIKTGFENSPRTSSILCWRRIA